MTHKDRQLGILMRHPYFILKKRNTKADHTRNFSSQTDDPNRSSEHRQHTHITIGLSISLGVLDKVGLADLVHAQSLILAGLDVLLSQLKSPLVRYVPVIVFLLPPSGVASNLTSYEIDSSLSMIGPHSIRVYLNVNVSSLSSSTRFFTQLRWLPAINCYITQPINPFKFSGNLKKLPTYSFLNWSLRVHFC